MIFTTGTSRDDRGNVISDNRLVADRRWPHTLLIAKLPLTGAMLCGRVPSKEGVAGDRALSEALEDVERNERTEISTSRELAHADSRVDDVVRSRD